MSRASDLRLRMMPTGALVVVLRSIGQKPLITRTRTEPREETKRWERATWIVDVAGVDGPVALALVRRIEQGEADKSTRCTWCGCTNERECSAAHRSARYWDALNLCSSCVDVHPSAVDAPELRR